MPTHCQQWSAMKFTSLPLLAALAGPVLFLSSLPAARAAEQSLMDVYKSGRAAFNKGDLVTAKAAFTKLLKADPNFEIGKIYMAQIRYAEAQWEARPRALKIVEKARIASIKVGEIPLSDALELVRREVEKAGTGPTAGPIAMRMDLPAEVLERPVSLSVQDVSMQSWIEAVAYAGGVRIAITQQGLSVTVPPVPLDPNDKTAVAAMQKMRQRAQDQVLARMSMDHTTLPDALAWLQQQADKTQGQSPLIVSRAGIPATTVTLDLRNVPLSEAIRTLAILADLDVEWCAWGAGLRPKSNDPGPAAAPAPKPDTKQAL